MELKSIESKEQFLSGSGETAKLIRSMDWSATALGPVESWPQSLRTSVSLCLSSTFPILIAWGPERIQIYNDSYRPICGAKHPEAMGMPFRVCWETAMPVVGDAFERGGEGEGTYINDQRMFLDRYGYIEESWMTFSFAPIRDESGGVGGIFHPITETTEKMLSGRRTQVLKELAVALAKAKSMEDLGTFTKNNYPEYLLDIPFMLIYQFDEQTGIASLVHAAGLETGTPMVPAALALSGSESTWPFAAVVSSGEAVQVNELQQLFGDFTCEPYTEVPQSAMVLPLKITGQENVAGFIVAGVSACRALDNAYYNFYEQLSNTYNTAISSIYAFEQEQKRAEALAVIDRSKTAFFSNVSHEFRTPLTLILGPLEDLLLQDLKQDIREPVQSVQRNALRLLKLVNNLLDYSRVEAGRTQAAYQECDLAELTRDLASSFRSIIEKAGMQLDVNCAELSAGVYVDAQMWEKIVLNLISNAFKYTLEGTISVLLRQKNNFVVMEVTDTGVGIPEKELPHMFERFHRVENSAGRTHEGSGIGLSLVHELVALHGGEITVTSEEGKGSTFLVRIPMGKAHLPQEQIHVRRHELLNGVQQAAFLEEASSLLEPKPAAVDHDVIEDPAPNKVQSADQERKILIVDDNADMRAYLDRILSPHFITLAAANGEDALEKISEYQPDLVLSDIMMPVMDGKMLLAKLRSQPETMRLPLIFLSARAGDEARVDGLEAGADDYLVKPFSVSELLTKIRAQLKVSKARDEQENVNDMLNLAVDAAAMGIWRVDLATDQLFVSERARIIHGLPLDTELLFTKTAELVLPLHRERLLAAIEKAIETKGSFNEDYQILALGSSKPKWINTSGMVETNEKKEVISVVGTILDITESKEDSQRKDDFIGMVSHELKTPLTSLNGFTQILQVHARKIKDDFAVDKLEKVQRQVKKMSTMINGFLNVSRLEAGKIDLKPTHFDITQLISETIKEVETEQHNFDYSPAGHIAVHADRDKISSVISNLLSNAMKYAPNSKEVEINSFVTDGAVTVGIRDHGMGIKTHDLEKLFNRFYRVESDDMQHISGFGIGLYLSSEIIERHGGKIWAESEWGKGATFYFSLPLAVDH